MEKLRNGEQIRKCLVSDGVDVEDDDSTGEGALEGELKGDSGDDDPVPRYLQECLGADAGLSY